MKKIVSLLFILTYFLYSCSSTSTTQNQIVEGRITNNSVYKGGANPPQEILDGLAVYRPSANQNFYVRNGANYAPFTPIITSFSTDNNGNYTISLPVGSYGIIIQEKLDFEQNPVATPDCEYLQEPDFILTVTNNQTTYTSQYTNKLNTCLALPQ